MQLKPQSAKILCDIDNLNATLKCHCMSIGIFFFILFWVAINESVHHSHQCAINGFFFAEYDFNHEEKHSIS